MVNITITPRTQKKINDLENEIEKLKLKKLNWFEEAKKGNLENINNMIKYEVIKDIDMKDTNYSSTALIYASENGHTDIVRVLIDSVEGQPSADVNAKDKYNKTALMFASENGHTDIVRILIDGVEGQPGADVNAKNEYNSTALMYASYNGYTDTVRVLIENGADINAKNKDNNTALMLASLNGHTDIVKILKDHQTKKEEEKNHLISPSSSLTTKDLLFKLIVEFANNKNIDGIKCIINTQF